MVVEAPWSNFDTYTVTRGPWKRYKGQDFKDRKQGLNEKRAGFGFFLCAGFLPVWLVSESCFTPLGAAVGVVLLGLCWCVGYKNADEGAWVGSGWGFSMNTPAGHDMFFFFSFDIRSRSKKLTELCFHSYLSTWDRRCLGRWGCSAEPADSGGLYLGGKEGEREWPASGDNRRQLRRPEPGERHLGQKGDEQTTTEKRVW